MIAIERYAHRAEASPRAVRALFTATIFLSAFLLFLIQPLFARAALPLLGGSLFTVLRDCGPSARTILGDARLRLATGEGAIFDLLVLDAFSSDAVPVHLLTREAFGVYRERMKATGMMVVHTSNRHYELDPVVARSAASQGLTAFGQAYAPDAVTLRENAYETRAVALTRDAGRIKALESDPRWVRMPEPPGRGWTDDYADPLSALKW